MTLPPRKRLLRGAIAAAVALLLVGRWLAGATASRLWAEALSVGAAHADFRWSGTALLVGAFALALAWCLGNLLVVYRSIGGVHVPRRVGNLEVLEAVPRRYLLTGVVLLGLGLAVTLSLGANGWWAARMLAGQHESTGLADPILGRDAAYYLFQFPWLRTLHGFAFRLTAVMATLVFFLYGAVGGLRWSQRRLAAADVARWHLGVLLAAFAAVLAVGYRMEPADLVATRGWAEVDTVLLDVRLPVSRTLLWLAVAAGAASLLWIRVRRVAVAAVPWVLLGGASLLGHHVLPAFASATRTPEELRLPGLERTRAAFVQLGLGLPATERSLPAAPLGNPPQLGEPAAPLRYAPVWDGFAVTVALNRTAGSGGFERFVDAGLGLYRAGAGEPVPVFVSTRHADLAAAGAMGEALVWADVHGPRFAASRGAVAVSAGRATIEGAPLFVPDLAAPDLVTDEPVSLTLQRSEAWFGPERVDFALVPADREAVLGVRRGGLLRRFALAWTLQSPPLLGANAFGDSALLVWHRDPTERLERYAPFARFSRSHAVVVNGRLTWVAAGMMTSPAFPLTTALRWSGETVRYLRYGLVGAVDAATGATTVYLVRDPDPLSAAWARIAPTIVRPFEAMPRGLAENAPYPSTLLEAQAVILRDRWGGEERRPPETPRVYPWVGPGAGDPSVRLRRLAVVEADGGTRILGMVDAAVRDGVPVVEVLRAPDGVELPGTVTLSRRFERAPGEQPGVPGPVRLVPLAGGVLALQSGYESREQFGAPRLVDVAVAWGDVVGHGANLPAALDRLRTGTLAEPGAEALWASARLWYERLEAARRSGDWAAFGQAYEALGRILRAPPDTAR